jgi:hypothetical protein
MGAPFLFGGDWNRSGTHRQKRASFPEFMRLTTSPIPPDLQARRLDAGIQHRRPRETRGSPATPDLGGFCNGWTIAWFSSNFSDLPIISAPEL